jgi:type I restriction-modification system DNA methylase subunit
MNDKNITLSQLEQYLSKAAWILKGPVDASDFKVYIFPLLFFKRISDVYHEEFQQALEESQGDKDYASLPEFHRFEIPKDCHWDDVRETTVNVGQKLEQAFRGIEQANQEFLYGIFGDAQWSNKNKLSDRLLIELIEHFSQYNLANSNVDPDILGQAYEMEACLLITNTNKSIDRKGKILIINAVKEVKQDKSITYLKEHHIQKIYRAYKNFKDDEGFCKVVSVEDILFSKANLAINLYVITKDENQVVELGFASAYESWTTSSNDLKKSMYDLFENIL